MTNLEKYKEKLKEAQSPGLVFICLVVCFSSLLFFILYIKQPLHLEYYATICLLIAIILIILIYRKILYNIRLDIKTMEFQYVRIQKWEKKVIQDAEPGSGALFIPILGNLFKKLWGQKMNPVSLYYLITNVGTISLEKEVFDKLSFSDDIYIVYSKYSNTLLGVEIKNKTA